MALRMRMAPISIIVAVDQEGGFGKRGKIPWNFSEDMKHFKETTAGGVCIMGRKTYEDMLEMVKNRRRQNIDKKNEKAIAEYEANQKMGDKPTKELVEPINEILPGRKSFVITSNDKFDAPGATVMPSLREAIQALDEKDKREVFVIGGRRMFIEALTWTHTVHMTVINSVYDCDVFFPIKSLTSKFKITEGTKNDDMYFVTYRRTSR